MTANDRPNLHVDRLSITLRGMATSDAALLANTLPAALQNALSGHAAGTGLADTVAADVARALAPHLHRTGGST